MRLRQFSVAAILITAACGSSNDDGATPTAPEVKKASLVIEVRGLPAGLSGDVALQSGASIQHFTSTNTLAGLTPGVYTVTVQPVENANARFAPNVGTQQVTLAPGEIRSLVIDYVETTGILVVGLGGLVAGTAPTIDVAGPANFAAHLSQADTLRKLTPGAYTVTATPTVGTSRFLPDSAVRTVRVDSARITSVLVRFQAVAQLTIQIDGLPAGVAASVDVTGPGPAKHLTLSATLSDLPLGIYVATPSTVTIGNDVYRATVQTTTLSFAGSNSILIHYVRLLGSITFRFFGGPAWLNDPVSPIVTVNGPGQTLGLSRDSTLKGMPFGTYRYTVLGPKYFVGPPGVNRAWAAVYSSSLEGRSDLAVTLDSLHTALTVDVPLSIVTGSVTFTAPGSMVTQQGSGAAISLFDSRGALTTFVFSGSIASSLPPGTYTGNAHLNGEYQTWYLPNVLSATTSISAAFPVGSIVIPYHLYNWPTISFVYSGMPAGLSAPYRVSSNGPFGGYSNEQFWGPATLSRWSVAYPGTKHLEVLMPALAADTSAAWTGSPNAFDFDVQEGQTSTITIAMRPTNILQVIATGAPTLTQSFATPAGMGTVTFPDGSIHDYSSLSSAGGMIMLVNQPVGTYVIKVNPLVLGSTRYVPDVASQTATLSATGRTIVRITYR